MKTQGFHWDSVAIRSLKILHHLGSNIVVLNLMNTKQIGEHFEASN